MHVEKRKQREGRERCVPQAGFARTASGQDSGHLSLLGPSSPLAASDQRSRAQVLQVVCSWPMPAIFNGIPSSLFNCCADQTYCLIDVH